MKEVHRRYFVDQSENKVTFVNVQDAEPILDANANDRAEEQTSDWGRKIGRIPNTLLLKWYYDEIHRGNTTLQMYSKEFDQLILKKLEDPDYAYLRTDKKPTIITGIMGFGS